MDAFAGSHGLSLDSFDFKGVASIGERQLVVDDLVMMSGNTAVRLRGKFIGGSEAIGVYLAGRVRDLPGADAQASLASGGAGRAQLVLENVTGGRISEGEFRIALPGRAGSGVPAGAHTGRNGRHALHRRECRRHLFRRCRRSAASASRRGCAATLSRSTTGGVVTLPSGKRLAVRNGSMRAHDLAPTVTPATFAVEAQASAEALRN